MKPGVSTRNFTPISSELPSVLVRFVGAAVAGKMVHGHACGTAVGVGLPGSGVFVGVAVRVGVAVGAGPAGVCGVSLDPVPPLSVIFAPVGVLSAALVPV